MPIPDRWRIVEALGYKNNIFDPYNRNVLKADRPVFGEDWFFQITSRDLAVSLPTDSAN